MVPCRQAQLEFALRRGRDVEMELDVFRGGARTGWRRSIGRQLGVSQRLLLGGVFAKSDHAVRFESAEKAAADSRRFLNQGRGAVIKTPSAGADEEAGETA